MFPYPYYMREILYVANLVNKVPASTCWGSSSDSGLLACNQSPNRSSLRPFVAFAV